jgi:hypothetical protein
MEDGSKEAVAIRTLTYDLKVVVRLINILSKYGGGETITIARWT